MRLLFFNGPVQNGDFTFASKPGKAVGIRIAEALNGLLGAKPVPHLWNTVRLDGDLRYRRHAAAETAPACRADFETAAIAAKYGTGPGPGDGTITDADQAVAHLALEIIEARLATGELTICGVTVGVCARCAHMTGTGDHPCRACGHPVSRQCTGLHLVADRDPATPGLDVGRIYAHNRRTPLHLQQIASNTPARLILSRTREYGIDLGPLGLPGLVLDARAGIHVTVLAAARARQTEVAVMTTTANAAANIAAYGQHFTTYGGARVRYALHGYVPYEHVANLNETYETLGLSPEAQTVFETWFLPLYALKEKNGIRSDQLPALLTHFHRSRLASVVEPDQDAVADLRQSIRQGATDWIGSKTALGIARGTTTLPER
ncbi:MAG: hypothetical protein ACRDQX_05650 [Pseudonocardiaceae bacterium]